jgi:putative ABC transport system permease protein
LTAAVELLGNKLGEVNPRSINRSDTVAQLNELRASISRIFIIVGLIASGLAMLGILNISLSRAREQVRDIAVRRAVGASRLQVFAELVGATVVIGIFAAIVAGIIGHVVFTFVIPSYVPILSGIDPPVFPVASLLAAVLLNSFIAVAGSSIPAFIASRRGFSQYLR